jgi:hypothetical protein
MAGLLKSMQLGNIQWSKSIGGTSMNMAMILNKQSNGNYVVAASASFPGWGPDSTLWAHHE